MARCTIRKITLYVTLVLVLVAVMAGEVFFPASALSASAATAYSSVLDDLKKDSYFTPLEYPVNNKDYGLQVIQIAESTDKELFVYVYQPCAERTLTANWLRFSTEVNENFAPKDYALKELNRAGVFVKYLVTDFTVKSDTVRYYDITAIHRPFNLEFDDPNTGATINGNYAETVAFSVGKLYTATTANGSVSYACVDIETITVTEKYVGLVRYDKGKDLSGFFIQHKTDSFYVAFSCDRDIERLLEADVAFVTQRFSDVWVYGIHTINEVGEKISRTAHLKYSDLAVSKPSSGIFWGETHEWKRIEKVSDFMADKDNDISAEAKKKLSGKQWVLRFFEDSFTYSDTGIEKIDYRTGVSEVTILRLKFKTDGKVYNLGIVDNHTARDPDALPDNTKGAWEKFVDFLTGIPWWAWLIFVGLVVLLISILGTIFTPIGKIALWLLNAVWRLVTLPFRAIGALFKACANRKEKQENAAKTNKKGKSKS